MHEDFLYTMPCHCTPMVHRIMVVRETSGPEELRVDPCVLGDIFNMPVTPAIVVPSRTNKTTISFSNQPAQRNGLGQHLWEIDLQCCNISHGVDK